MATAAHELPAGFKRAANGNDDKGTVSGAERIDVEEYSAATPDPGTPDLTESASDGPEPAKRRPGRPPKSGGESSTKSARKSSKNLSLVSADHIEGVHRIAALYTGIPVIALERGEAEKISDAIQRVMSEYDLGEINPKLAAWLNLLGVLAMVYGMKVFAFKAWREAMIAQADEAANAGAGFFGDELTASNVQQAM